MNAAYVHSVKSILHALAGAGGSNVGIPYCQLIREFKFVIHVCYFTYAFSLIFPAKLTQLACNLGYNSVAEFIEMECHDYVEIQHFQDAEPMIFAVEREDTLNQIELIDAINRL